MKITTMIVLALCSIVAPAHAADVYDIVLKSGRVIDPETGLDGIRDVGIRGDTIAAVSTGPLEGTHTIDARGLVIAPGFIDLHQHGQNSDAQRLAALDGVTTALELELGVADQSAYAEARRGRSLIHFGASASYLGARLQAWGEPLPESLGGPAAGFLPKSGPATNEPATPERLEKVLVLLREQLDAGALGIGMGLEYAPGTTRREVVEVFRVAASHGRPVFVHARGSGYREPGSGIESVTEVIGAAAISGAPLHIVHVNSTCMGDSPECLSMIAGARAHGIDVTTEAYPYTVAMTQINSALFNPGWRERRGLDYGDLELPDTGERLTKERFDVLHASPEQRPVLIHMNPDSVVDAVLADPTVIVASDGVRNHPRGAGTYARVLARYVRDLQTLSLIDAMRKMSLLPAQRLEKATPEAKRLGRLQPGARADIVVFDPRTIQDRATYRAPTEPSVGVSHLLVAGTPVVRDGRIVEAVAPGEALLGKPH